jgi:predicted  nucleic acid-binding Zn-ribbon protein
MTQLQGLTPEMYKAIVAVVDDRMKSIRVTRREYDRLVAAQARTEAALDRLAEAQARTEARVNELAEAQARTEARLDALAEAQARTEARVNELAEAQRRTEEALKALAEAQARTEARVKELAEAQARTEARVKELAEAQARMEAEFQKYREASEARFARIEAALDRLAEAQARTEARVKELAEAQARTEAEFQKYREASEARFARIEATLDRLTEAQAQTEAQLRDLVQVVKKMQDTLAAVKGRQLEFNYHYRAGAYFGPLLRRLRAFLPVELESELETRLSAEDFRDLLSLDLVVTGQPRHLPDAPQVWLAVEVSSVVDRHDVERAIHRAGLLRRAGLRAIPVVAGEDITVGAQRDAEAHRVVVLQDGQALFWEAALADVLG